MSDSRFLFICPVILVATITASFGQQSPQDGSKQAAAASNPFSMDLDQLMNTTVTTASKFSEKLSDAPSVVSVVTKDELRRFGGFTLLEILERVAGLTGSSAFFADRSIVAVRGDQTRTDAGHI